MASLHRVLLGVILLGNAIAFAGVDPIARVLTAAVVLILVIDLRRLPHVPNAHALTGALIGVLACVQLVPLPGSLRQLLQPGFVGVMRDGWAPLSLAPWATVQAVSGGVVVIGIALVAARMASTRSGLPSLLTLIAATGLVTAILGLASETGSPDSLLLVRELTSGGGPYGPFVNCNHFALAMELSIPASIVLLVAGSRHLRWPGAERQRAVVVCLAAAVAVVVEAAALLRTGSRGGALFILVPCVLALPLWQRQRAGRRWPWALAIVAVLIGVSALAWTRLPLLQERFSQLLIVDGIEGNGRLDLWRGTIDLWMRAPLFGAGIGSYRHVIGLDKPATGSNVLMRAHNDWLEWTACAGAVGLVALLCLIVGMASLLRPGRLRRLRFEYRYPLAGLTTAVLAAALHELVDFGLQAPLNRYLVGAWFGLLWGVTATISARSASARGEAGTRTPAPPEEDTEPDAPVPEQP
jgi:hypothetical protein